MSCHLETSNNGDLDGLWQATIKEDIATGEVVDLRDYQATWSFQGKLVQMNASSIPNHVVGTFIQTENYLKVDKLSIFTSGKGDEPISDVAVLEVFGFTKLDETFELLELNSNALRLQNDKVRLTFRKY
ncbi:MAG: lipocalin-like domain-containing protein [Prevotella sp.]|nr:lipocalin-like domain-containing protein [Prevotella sp.]